MTLRGWLLESVAPLAAVLPFVGGLLRSSAGGATVVASYNRNQGVVSVLDFGAKCDGVTDDTAAVNSALASGAGTVTIPAGKCCFLPNGITVPTGVELQGLSFQADNPTSLPPPGCSSILTNGNINSVTVGSGVSPATRGARLTSLFIYTNAAAKPTAGAGVYVNTGYNVQLDHVLVWNCYNGYYFKSVATSGISGFMSSCHSGKIAGYHVVQDTWPELRMDLCRFGQNGNTDFGALAYVYVTGGNVAQVTPNGFYAGNCQFNESGASRVGSLISFGAMTAGANGLEWKFLNCHAEAETNVVTTDATVTQLADFSFVGCTIFWIGGSFWNLNAATVATQIKVAGCDLQAQGGGTFTMGPAKFWECEVVGNDIYGNVVLNSNAPSADSTLNFIGNGVVGNITLTGGWGSLNVSGSMRGGTLTNTATGSVAVSLPAVSTTFSAPLNANAGISAPSGGISFGSQVAASVTDFTKQIALYGTTSGICVTANNINYSIASGNNHTFLVAGTQVAQFTATSATINQPLTVGGLVSEVGLSLGSNVASGPTDLSKQIALYGTTAGFSITANRLNIVGGAGNNVYVTIAGTDVAHIDTSGHYYVGANQVVGAQITGYGTPTGGAKLASFPGATATLAQTSGALAQLILDLKTHGLLGA